MRYISAIPGKADALPWPRRLAVMGSTGSIGRNTLHVVTSWPQKFTVTALAGGRNIALLAEQAARWRPAYLAILDEPCESAKTSGADSAVDALKKLLPRHYQPEILTGPDGFATLAALDMVDMVLSAQVGAAGLRATVAAARAGKTICLANKESLVLAGPLLRAICADTGAVLLPVDSEHSALFQCMMGRQPDDIARLVLTASGGPFLGKARAFLRHVRPQNALQHPTWNMGAKISIDSSTLMNKGLEIIEACYLYDMPVEQVDVVVHPQSIVHSLVELKDGSLMAQLAQPNMRLPIAASLAWPEMLDNNTTGIALLDLTKAGTLSFETPDAEAFPCLDLARRALATHRTVELNAANEVAVARFLAGDIGFMDIPALVAAALDFTEIQDHPGQAMHSTPVHSAQDVDATLAALETLDTATRNRAALWHA